MADHVHMVPHTLLVNPTGHNAYRCVGTCDKPDWPLWGTVDQGGVYLRRTQPGEPFFRVLWDEYVRELMQYWPPGWADEFPPDADGHMPNPALLGPDPEPNLVPSLIMTNNDRDVAGLVVLREWPEWGEVRELFVRPDWRRQGVGRSVVEQLQQRWPNGILIEVLRGNAPAEWFWTKLGFERIGESQRWGPEATRYIAVHAWPRSRFNIGKPG